MGLLDNLFGAIKTIASELEKTTQTSQSVSKPKPTPEVKTEYKNDLQNQMYLATS